MVRSSWPDRKASVILLPSGRQGEAILELASEWTQAGLLGPALWVRPEHVRRTRSGPPRIGATVLLRDGENRVRGTEVDLFEALARQTLSLVRLVKVRSALPTREIDDEQDEIAGLVGEYLTRAMPMAVPSSNIVDQATELSRLTLICAPTDFQLQQRVDWAASEYGTVVIASPEDRASPWSGDAFVHDDDRFIGFCLMHVASVAGLWNGAGAGTFELVPHDASSNQSVWVSRVFLNAVITEALGRRTAAFVLDNARRADSLIVDPSAGAPPAGTAFIDDELVPAYLERMVEASMSLDQGALRFHPSPVEEIPVRGRIGIFAQLKGFLVFAFDSFIAAPRWGWRWLTSRASRELTKRLQSDEGRYIVGDEYEEIMDARDALLMAKRDDILAAEHAARASVTAPVGISRMRTTPKLWARLRELVFGALDGSSDLSDLGFAPIEDRVPVFGRVSDVFPRPDETWSVDDGPEGLRLPVDWHTLAQTDPRGALVQWMEDADAPVDEPEEPEEQREPDEQREPEADETSEPEADETSEPEESAPTERDRRAAAVDDYDSWAADRDRSFAWQLCVRLAADRSAAADAVEQFAREISEIEVPPPGELILLRKKFHRRMVASWGSAGGLAGGLFALLGMFSAMTSFLQFLGPVAPGPAAILAIAAIGAVAFSSGALAAYHRGWSAFQRRVDLTQAHLQYVSAASRHARQELARLTSLHRQAVDWLDLLARAIHDPWRVREEWLATSDEELDENSLPFAMSIGTVVENDHAAIARLRRMTTEHLLRRGWRAEAFRDLVREVGDELGQDATSFSVAMLDDDLPHSSNNTRRMLRQSMSGDSVQVRVAAPRLRALMDEIQRRALHRSRPHVVPVGSDVRDLLAGADDLAGLDEGVAWDDFLVAALAGRREPVTPLSTGWVDARDVQEGYHEHVTSYLVVPERLEQRLQFPADAPISTVPLRGANHESLDLVWRADVVGPLPIGSIGLWSGARPSSAPGDEAVVADRGV